VQQGVVIAEAAQVQNLVTLYKVLGGGWTDRSDGRPAVAVPVRP
jgi:hypothetical protein